MLRIKKNPKQTSPSVLPVNQSEDRSIVRRVKTFSKFNVIQFVYCAQKNEAL